MGGWYDIELLGVTDIQQICYIPQTEEPLPFGLMLLRLGNATIIYMHIHATYMYTHTICTYNTHNM